MQLDPGTGLLQLVEPEYEIKPDAHDMQSLAPLAAEYVPGSQVKQ